MREKGDIYVLWKRFQPEILLSWNLEECLKQFLVFYKNQTGLYLNPITSGISLFYRGDYDIKRDYKFIDVPNFDISKLQLLIISAEKAGPSQIFEEALKLIAITLPNDKILELTGLFTKLYHNLDIDIKKSIIQYMDEIK